MGRKRTRLTMSRTERGTLVQLLRGSEDERARERAKVALWAATGRHTLEDLAQKAGRARATIQNWLDKYRAGGLAGLLERHTPPGSISPIGSAAVQAQLRVGLRAGRWRSASEVAGWLQNRHGIERARKSVYYWFAKLGRRGRLPANRSRHRRAEKRDKDTTKPGDAGQTKERRL